MKYFLLLAFAGINFISCKKNTATPVVIASIHPMKEGPGAPVTITGTGFGMDATACKVLFNGKPAVIDVFSDTLLKVTVPAGSSNGKIQVMIGSQSAISSDDFTVLMGIWKRITDFPSDGRTNHVSFTIGNKGYVGLGDANGPVFNDLYEFDASTNTWNKKANYPVAEGNHRCTAIAVGDKAYIIGGSNAVSPFGTSLFEYNATTNTWASKTNIPSTGRFYSAGFSLNNKIYYGSGTGDFVVGGEVPKDWWEYDPSIDKWTRKKDLPFGDISNAIAFTIGNKGYLGACYYSNPQRLFYQYDANTDTWTRMADFPGLSNYYASSFVMNGKGYVVAGTGNECYEYDPDANTWTQRTSLPTYRTGGVGFSIGNKGYIVCGAGIRYIDKESWEFTLQ